MREVVLTDTLVHEYTEYEWFDKAGGCNHDEIAEITHTGVVAAEKAGMRFFQVLVKPNDELLDEGKPRNALLVDTWKYRAAQKALESDVTTTSAIIALFARLLDAKYGPGVEQLIVSVPGYGNVAINIPEEHVGIFKALPEIEANVKCTPVNRLTILEAVFVHDRKRHG